MMITPRPPEELWNWLAKTSSETGADFTAIPHNSNLSMGNMFSEVTFDGEPLDADYVKETGVMGVRGGDHPGEGYLGSPSRYRTR